MGDVYAIGKTVRALLMWQAFRKPLLLLCLVMGFVLGVMGPGCDCGGQVIIGEGESPSSGESGTEINKPAEKTPDAGKEPFPEIVATDFGPEIGPEPTSDASEPVVEEETEPASEPLQDASVPEEPEEGGFVGPRFHFKVNTAVEDTVPPKLLKVEFFPTSVKAGDTVRVDMTVGVDLSEVTNAQITVAGPKSLHSVYVDTAYHPSRKVFTAVFRVPNRAESGDWVVQRITMQDGAGRPSVYTSSQAPAKGVTFKVTSADADTKGPELKKVSLEKTSVNPGETLMVEVEATDSGVGITDIEVEAEVKGGGARLRTRVLYNPITKKFVGLFRIPSNAVTSSWSVSRVDLSDFLYNRTFKSATDPILKGLSFDVKSSNSPPTPDTTKPNVVSAWLEPNTVNDGEQIRVIVNANDATNGSGVARARATIANPSGAIRFQFDLRQNASTGYWEGTGRVPKYSVAGIWRLASIVVSDKAGNTTTVANDELYKLLPYLTKQELGNRKAHLTLQAKETNPAPDRKTPLLAGLNIAPGSIKAGEAMRVYAQINDPGGSGISSASCTLTGPSGRLTRKTALLSYNSDTGFFEGTVSFRADDQVGDWWISGCFLQDKSGNTASYAGWAITKFKPLDISRATSNASKDPYVVKVTMGGSSSSSDTTPPSMSSINLAPGVIVGGGQIRVFAKVDDQNGSGVSGGSCEFKTVQGLGLGFDKVTSITGFFEFNPATGFWESNLRIPSEAIRGEWWLQTCQWTDKEGNRKIVDAVQVANLTALAVPHISIAPSSHHLKFELKSPTGTQDTQPPKVDSINVAPSTATGGESARVYVKASDNEGIASAFCSLKPSLFEAPFSAYGAAQLAYNPATKLWEGDYRFSPKVFAGFWSISGCQVLDLSGNKYNGGPDLIQKLSPESLSTIVGGTVPKRTTFTMNNPNTLDRTPPVASKLKWLPTTQVKAGQSAILQAEATDQGLGILRIEVMVQSPSGQQQQFGNLPYNLATKAFEGVIRFPDNAETGKWKVVKLDLYDWGGNIKNYTSKDTLLDKTQIQVVGGTPSADKKAPEVKSVKASRTVVLAGESVRWIAEITDDLSGVSGANLDLVSPKKGLRTSAFLRFNPATKKWEGEATLPLKGEDGVWKVASFSARDNAGRFTSLDQNSALLKNLSVTVRNTPTQSDTEAPTIQNLSIAPATIKAQEQVRIMVEAKDNSSGVAGVSVILESSNKERLFFLELKWNPATKRWGVNHTLRIDAPGGLYEVTSITLRDKAGNTKTISKGSPFLP